MLLVYMLHGDKMERKHLNQLAHTLGIDNIDAVLTTQQPPQPPHTTMGPKPYWGGYYGSVSIHDFPTSS